MRARVLGPGEGTRYEARGSAMLFKALAADTGGAFSLMEREVPPGGRRPPPHRHPGAEAFYVLDGELEFEVEGETAPAGPGTFVLVPAGAGHTFGNASARPARVLILHAPAADAYFADLEALWAEGEPPVEAQRDLLRRHGMEPA